MHIRTSRNRHGRGIQGPVLSQALPRYRSRSEQFDAAVLEAYAPILRRFSPQLSGLDIAVDVVPRMRWGADSTVLPDNIVADGPVPLGRVLSAGVDPHGRPTRARIVIFRKPVEQRVVGPRERHELLTWILTALVAHYVNMDPRDIDPKFER